MILSWLRSKWWHGAQKYIEIECSCGEHHHRLVVDFDYGTAKYVIPALDAHRVSREISERVREYQPEHVEFVDLVGVHQKVNPALVRGWKLR